MNGNDNNKKFASITVDLKNTDQFKKMVGLLRKIYDTTSEDKIKDLILAGLKEIALNKEFHKGDEVNG